MNVPEGLNLAQIEALGDDELALIRQEAASIADDWAERQLIEPNRKECDAKFVREVLRLVLKDEYRAAGRSDL